MLKSLICKEFLEKNINSLMEKWTKGIKSNKRGKNSSAILPKKNLTQKKGTETRHQRLTHKQNLYKAHLFSHTNFPVFPKCFTFFLMSKSLLMHGMSFFSFLLGIFSFNIQLRCHFFGERPSLLKK